MRKSGAYDGFKLEWDSAYDIKRLIGGNTRVSHAASDVRLPISRMGRLRFYFRNVTSLPGTTNCTYTVASCLTSILRAEAVCYFLNSPDGKASTHREELEACLEETIDRIEKAQHPDGYLGIYFTVVDPRERFMNLRDMHELCKWIA